MPAKKPWESKTIIVAALLGLFSVLTMFIPGLHVVGDWINANGAVVATVWSVLAIGLRLITKGAVSLGD